MGSQASPSSFFVGVAVLGDDGGDALGVGGGEAEAGGGAVVEDVDGVAPELQGLDEGIHGEGEVVEGVLIISIGGDVGEAEAGEIGGDDAEPGCEERDEVAKHVGGTGVAVEEQEHGGVGGAGFAVEDFHAVGFDGVEPDGRDGWGVGGGAWRFVIAWTCEERSGRGCEGQAPRPVWWRKSFREMC